MNPIARLERACARLIEETFARLFPSDLDPVQVGRKLTALMHAGPGDLFLVRVHPADYVRFAADRDYLEARWSAALRDAAAPDRTGGAPRALLHEDARVVAGTVSIESVVDDEGAGLWLELRDGSRVPLRDGLRLGRAKDNDVVVADARASRHHARIRAGTAGFALEDIGSSNGTFLDGRRLEGAGALEPGAVLTIGDTHLRVTGHG